MSKQTIGEFLATLRRAKGLTQVSVSERLGISNRTLSAWECGTALPDILLLPALAELYGVTVDEIIAGERLIKEAPEIAERSHKKLFLGKLARFTSSAVVLTGLMMLGIILFVTGFSVQLTIRAWVGFQWWILLMFLGLALTAVAFIILLSLYVGARGNCDTELEGCGEFMMLLSRRMADCCYCIALTFAASAVLTSFLNYSHENDMISMLVINVLGMLIFGLTAFFTHSAALKRFGSESVLEARERIFKRLKKCALWGLVPLALAVLSTVVYFILTEYPVGKDRDMCSADSFEELRYELETFYFDPSDYRLEADASTLPDEGEYYLNLSGNEGTYMTYVYLGNGFYGLYYKNVCFLYCGSGAESEFHEIARIYKYYTDDKQESVYITKYLHEPFPMREDGGIAFEIEEREDEWVLVLPAEPVDDAELAPLPILTWFTAAIYGISLGVLAAVLQRKIKVKL